MTIQLDENLAKQICQAVDRGFDEQVAFTQELVRFPSRRGAEQTAQDFMAKELRRRGYAVDRWPIEVEAIRHLPGFSPVSVDYANAVNVVGALRPETSAGRSLILNGHIDVVPEGPLEMWSRPPYEPHRADGWLHGRGSGDMKAGLAGAVYAVEALARLGFRPAAELYLQSVVEEECTGNGALACLARGYRAEAALIPEPFGDALLRAQLGVMWFQVKVQGHPVHVAYADTVANAIESAYVLIRALRELEARWNEARRLHGAFAEHDHPIHFNVGKIAGGDWASSVPSWCLFDMRVGVYPGDDLAARQAEIEQCLRQAAAADPFLANAPPHITYNGFLAEGYTLPPDTEAERVLAASHEQAYGEPLKTLVSTATTDARFFGLYAGIPALVYGPRAENIHGFDERVNLESVRRNTQAMALFVANWCGLERRERGT